MYVVEDSGVCLVVVHVCRTVDRVVGYPRPSAGIGVPWVLTGTHPCAFMPRVASKQSANLCGWCSREIMWSWTWSERCVFVNFLSTVGTDNTYTIGELNNTTMERWHHL